MPTFITGRGRQVAPARATPIATGETIGAESGAAMQQFGQVLVDVEIASMERDAQERKRKEDADKARGLAALKTGKEALKGEAERIGNRIKAGEIDGIAAIGELDSARTSIVDEITKDLPKSIGHSVSAFIKAEANLRVTNDIGHAVEIRQRDETRAGLNQALEGYERDALVDRPKAVMLAGAALATLGGSAGYGAADQQRLMQGFREKTARNTADQRLLANSGTLANLEKFQQELRGDEFADLSPDVRERLEVRIENKRAGLQHAAEVAQRRAEAAQARRLTEGEHATRAVQAIVDAGGIADDATLRDAQTKTAGTPWAAVLKETVQQAASRSAFGSLAPAQQDQALLEIRARLNRDGANPHQVRQLQQFEAIRSRTREQVDKDPLAWGVQSRLLDGIEPLRIGTIDDLVKSIDARVDQARTVGAALRQPVSPLLASEAHSLGDLLAPLPPSQKATALQALAVRMDAGQTQALARQIDPKNRALGLALAAGAAETTFDRLTAELILRGQAALDSKLVVKDDAAESGLTARIARKLDGAVVNPVQAAAYADAAKLVYYAKRAENNQLSAEDATELVLRGKIYDFNGAKVVLPQGVNVSEMERRLSNYPPDVLAAQLPDGKVYVRGQALDAAQFRAALPSAQLRWLAQGRYAVLAGGTVVSNVQGNPVVIYSTPTAGARPGGGR